jgi:hypothetical protein
MSKRGGEKIKGVGQRTMRRQEERVATDRADYQAIINQAAKDFVGLNPKLDCNDPENLAKAWKNFSEGFLPDYLPAQTSPQEYQDSVFTPMPRASGSRALKIWLLALVAANMVTVAGAELFRETHEEGLLTPPATPRRNLRGGKSVAPASPPPPPTVPAARELPAVPYITQDQLEDFVTSQRDPSNPKKIISLAPLLATYRTASGLLVLPAYIAGDYSEKLSLSNVDFNNATIPPFFENVDLSGAVMSGRQLRTSFEKCELKGAKLDHITGRVRIDASDAGEADFSDAAMRLEIGNGFSNFTKASFERAHLTQKDSIVAPHRIDAGSALVHGLDLTGATVTLLDNDGNKVETIAATSPLVASPMPETPLAPTIIPGFALQTGAPDREVEVTLKSNETECPDYSTALAPVELEEFAETFNNLFTGYNVVATTNSSAAEGSVVRSEINLYESSYSGASTSAKFFPQLKTRILFDKSLPPAEAQLKVMQKILSSFGMSADACQMQVDGGQKLPPQNSSYLSVRTHEYLKIFAGRDPALAGCTLSVGLEPNQFKIVAGDVEMRVDQKFCGEGNEFGFTCKFNQKVEATHSDRRGRWQIPDMDVSLNTIEKDGAVVGYVIAVDEMKKVDGAATGPDETRCPPPPPTPPKDSTATAGMDALYAFGGLFAAVLVCCCGHCMHARCKSQRRDTGVRTASTPEEGIEMVVTNPIHTASEGVTDSAAPVDSLPGPDLGTREERVRHLAAPRQPTTTSR